jgi:membrane-bound lytic murein transglycosylase A
VSRRAVLVIVALLAACQVAPPAPPRAPETAARAKFVPATFDALPGWADDRQDAAWPALVAGCRALVAAPNASAVWPAPCAAAASVDGTDPRAVRAFIESQFSPYRVLAADGSDLGLVTGYYEPLLAGSRTPTEKFAAPLYAVPDDLLTVDLATLYPELKDKRVRGRIDGKRVVPYWPRADIERGNAPLGGKAIAYVAEPVDAFFLQIQGSGRIRLDDGSVMRVGYADQNGHPFRSIARVLIERGELTPERASKQAIEAWGRANPDKLPALLDENPSYVFFREIPAPAPGSLEAAIDGPIGTLGVPLLAERTIAVDARVIPLGAPVFLATTYPLSPRPLTRLVLAQDTGGAIRGAVRADFFWGAGDAAGREAGRMRQEGRMWLLWPKGAVPPLP